MIDLVSGCDDLDFAVVRRGYTDDLVVAENVDSPSVGIESGVPVVDAVLSVAIFIVLAFVDISVGLFAVAAVFRLSIGQRSIAPGFE